MFRCTQCGWFARVPDRHRAATATCGKCGTGLDVSGRPQAVGDGSLSRALMTSPVPVLVDFWAAWCAPCVMAAPALDQIGRAFPGELLVLKVDIERAPRSAEMHGIRGVPTFVLFSGGMEQARQIGMLPRGQLSEWVARHLASVRAHGGAAAGAW